LNVYVAGNVFSAGAYSIGANAGFTGTVRVAVGSLLFSGGICYNYTT